MEERIQKWLKIEKDPKRTAKRIEKDGKEIFEFPNGVFIFKGECPVKNCVMIEENNNKEEECYSIAKYKKSK